MNKKALTAWIILLLVCMAGVAVFILMKLIPRHAPVAQIYSEGKLIRTVSLSESCEFTITTDNGYNIVQVSDGSISVTEADCPDKVCINSGAVSSGAIPIICLPHKLEIRIVSGDKDIDAVIN